jgi:hypothetical protein
MYNALLDRVITVINRTVGHKPEEEERSEFFNYMFNPEAYLATQEKKRKQEERVNKLIAGATILAVGGELYHLTKRSGILNKFKKK